MGAIVDAKYDLHSGTHTFNLAVADYVRDPTNSFLLECVCHHHSLLHNQTATLDIGASVYVYGTLHGMNAFGDLNIALNDISLIIAPGFMGPLLPHHHNNHPSPMDPALPPRHGEFPLALANDQLTLDEISLNNSPSELHLHDLSPLSDSHRFIPMNFSTQVEFQRKGFPHLLPPLTHLPKRSAGDACISYCDTIDWMKAQKPQ
ncbi:hypothetical protein JB92DRAFT_2825857 [Gautieria morchelliformis]|nr:hypothetical protein JB92DRAFT_2825857 [Gautieria morchelliformis]